MMVEKFDKSCLYLEKLTFVVLITLLCVMLAVAWSHVFWRYILERSLFWSEEFLRFSLVWFALLSASVIFKRKGHLGIGLFVQKLPEEIKNKISNAIIYIFLLLNLTITYQGFSILGKVHDQLTPALQIPVSIPYASIPVSFLLMTFYGISDILHQIRKQKPINHE